MSVFKGLSFPDDWTLCEARECIDVRDGTHDSPKYLAEGYPLVTSKNLVDGEIDFSNCSYISEKDQVAISKRSAVDDGDILYAMIGTIGNPVIVKKKFEFSIKNVALLKFTKSNVVNRYIYYFLKSDYTIRQFERKSRGGTQKFVSLTNIRELEIPLAPLAEQKKIATILDAADQLRQKDQQLIDHYTALSQSLFLEMFGLREAELQGWPLVEIKELAARSKGSMRTGPFGSSLLHSEFHTTGDVAVLGIDNAVQNKFRWPEEPRFITYKKYEELAAYQILPGDVITTIMGTIGRSAVIPDDIPLAINTKHLAAITLNREIASPQFLSFSIHSDPYITSQFAARNRGAIMNGLNLTIIRETQLHLPPIDLQNRFAEHLKTIEEQKEQAQASLDASTALFNSLLQRAFKGELTSSQAA